MEEKKVAKKAEAKPKEKVEKAAKPAQPKMHKRSILGRKKTEAEVEEQKIPETKEAITDPFATIKFVVMTEKAIQLIEKQNKLVFVVNRGATKNDIRKAAESVFSANVSNVQTMIDQLGRKKAFVKFAKPGEAGEIAIRLGII